MKLFVLLGQRIERYPGQYGLEALAVMTEYDTDANPEYLPEQKRRYDGVGEFTKTEIITLSVDEKLVREVLFPVSSTVIPTTVKGAMPRD